MKPKTKELVTKPNERHGYYGPAATVLIVLLAYFGSQLLGGVIIGSVAGLFGYDEARIRVLFESSAVWQFAFIFVVEALTLLILWWFISVRKVALGTIGLGRRPAKQDVGYALIAFGIYFVLLIVVIAVVSAIVPGINLDQEQQLGFDPVSGKGPLALIFVSLVILPAIVEEIMVRGFLYTGLRRALPYISAALSTSLLFGAAHLQLGSGAPPLWVAGIDTFVLSMVLIELRERTGALWAGMLVHGLKNTLAFIGLFILAAH